jgi:hypothetical protein
MPCKKNNISSGDFLKGKYAINVKKKIAVGNKDRKKVNDNAEDLKCRSLLSTQRIKNSKTEYHDISL